MMYAMQNATRVIPHGEHTRRHTLPLPVAEALRSARARRGWSVREAAHHVGISFGHLSMLERGHRCPSLTVARDLTRVLLSDQPDASRSLLEVARPDAGRDWRPS